MDYEKITVKALCERAKINKKTFYRYYETMDFLLSEIMDEFSTDFLNQIKNYYSLKILEISRVCHLFRISVYFDNFKILNQALINDCFFLKKESGEPEALL